MHPQSAHLTGNHLCSTHISGWVQWEAASSVMLTVLCCLHSGHHTTTCIVTEPKAL